MALFLVLASLLGPASRAGATTTGTTSLPEPTTTTTATTTVEASTTTVEPDASTTTPIDTTAVATTTSTTLDEPRPGEAPCTKVAHIGDSTTVALGPGLERRYEAAGWSEAIVDAGVGRSVFNHVRNDVSGVQAVRRIKEAGFGGCWVIALGINDSLGIDAGFRRTASQHVKAMLDAIGDAPVLWVGVNLPRRTATAGRFNDAIVADPRATYYDWPGDAAGHANWMSTDQVHHTTAGNRAYAEHIVAASLVLLGRPAPVGVGRPPTPPTTAATPLTMARGPASAAVMPPFRVTGLRYGSTGPEVAMVQRRLFALGYDPGTSYGRFDSRTVRAVKAFQKARQLPAHGVVGSLTLASLGVE